MASVLLVMVLVIHRDRNILRRPFGGVSDGRHVRELHSQGELHNYTITYDLIPP